MLNIRHRLIETVAVRRYPSINAVPIIALFRLDEGRRSPMVDELRALAEVWVPGAGDEQPDFLRA